MQQYLYKISDFHGDSLDLFDLFSDEPHAFFLDSSQHDPHRGRYSFIGFDPFDTVVHKGKDTLELLKGKFAQYTQTEKQAFTSPYSPLTAGIVGYLSYDYGLYHERIQLNAQDDLNLPDAFFGFYDCILTIDHFTQKLFISSSGLPEKNERLREKRASERLDYITRKLSSYEDKVKRPTRELPHESDAPLVFKSNFTKEQYQQAVLKALHYIECGDIYQVNLSQRFDFDLMGRDFDPRLLYKAMRNISPVAFGGYLNCGEHSIISNSPERFLSVDGRVAQTRPMKGTRPRGTNEQEDRKLRDELIHSAKEKAELMMITDLMRNDLGRVCDYGTIGVKEMRTIEEYGYVFQATSTVEGLLRKEKDCFDLIQACFPGGSITGCPKIRSMEIIEELEPTRRGIYTGTMGYINFAGNMDFNILIRTLLAHRNKLYFQVGGGIVADSTPEREYEETLIKAKAMRDSLQSVFCRGENVAVSKIKE